MSHLFCFGFGYCAERLAARLAARGWRISGTATTALGVARIQQLGYAAALFDGTSAAVDCARLLQSATHVLVSIPPDEGGDDVVLRWHASDIAGASRPQWVGYLSTVGVYGDRQGGWVDETAMPTPISDRSQRRLAAEQAWLEFGATHSSRVEILRLAGIYGPGRSVIDQLRRGTAKRIVKPGQVFNRIHVDDVAATLDAAMAAPCRHTIYNVADDEPTDGETVLLYAAQLLAVTPPPAVAVDDAQLSPMARSFYAECRRVSNHRIKTALGIKLLHPTYREGLSAIATGGA